MERLNEMTVARVSLSGIWLVHVKHERPRSIQGFEQVQFRWTVVEISNRTVRRKSSSAVHLRLKAMKLGCIRSRIVNLKMAGKVGELVAGGPKLAAT